MYNEYAVLDAMAGDTNDSELIQFAGMTPTDVAAAGTGTVPMPLKSNLALRRVVFGDAACVAKSRLTDITIGTISLNVGTQGIPCEAFRYDATYCMIRAGVVASPILPPNFLVANDTAASIKYEGGAFGQASSARAS